MPRLLCILSHPGYFTLHCICYICLNHWYIISTCKSIRMFSKLSSTYILQMSVKLANDVFFVPILTTCGGFITNFFFSPVTISGFLARIMSNTLVNNCVCYKTMDQCKSISTIYLIIRCFSLLNKNISLPRSFKSLLSTSN